MLYALSLHGVPLAFNLSSSKSLMVQKFPRAMMKLQVSGEAFKRHLISARLRKIGSVAAAAAAEAIGSCSYISHHERRSFCFEKRDSAAIREKSPRARAIAHQFPDASALQRQRGAK